MKAKEIRVESFYGEGELNKFLRENPEMEIIDIKFAISQGNSMSYAVIYKK